jgi:hypothetical protein
MHRGTCNIYFSSRRKPRKHNVDQMQIFLLLEQMILIPVTCAIYFNFSPIPVISSTNQRTAVYVTNNMVIFYTVVSLADHGNCEMFCHMEYVDVFCLLSSRNDCSLIKGVLLF